jgi:aryl-alcohol dehydrogenase-like predicted oxidoreductase
VFGWTLDEEHAFEVLDAYAQAGGNFIDTADSYGHWTPAGAGFSERIIGRWMAARGNRDRIVIATKVGSSPERPGLSEGAIRAAIEGSLGRLGTDRVDLYYAHRDDLQTPLHETLATFQSLIEEGKVRHAAASNYGAARLREALQLGARAGMASYVALQPQYNLLDRDSYEGELQQLCASAGLACLPYYGLASGFLTGKYRSGQDLPDSPRAATVRERYLNERGLAVLASLDQIAAARDAAVATVALAWLRMQPTVVAPIASATSSAQLRQLTASVALQLSPQELDELDAASRVPSA